MHSQSINLNTAVNTWVRSAQWCTLDPLLLLWYHHPYRYLGKKWQDISHTPDSLALDTSKWAQGLGSEAFSKRDSVIALPCCSPRPSGAVGQLQSEVTDCDYRIREPLLHCCWRLEHLGEEVVWCDEWGLNMQPSRRDRHMVQGVLHSWFQDLLTSLEEWLVRATFLRIDTGDATHSFNSGDWKQGDVLRKGKGMIQEEKGIMHWKVLKPVPHYP